MSKIGLIIKREYGSRVKKRSFIIMTILVPILAAGFLIGAVILGMPEDKNIKVLVVDDTTIATLHLLEKQAKSSEIPPTQGSLITDPEKLLNNKYKFTPYDHIEKGESYEDVLVKFETDENMVEYDMLLYVPASNDGGKSKLFNKVKVIYREIPSSKVQTHLSQLMNTSVEMAKLHSLVADSSCLDDNTYNMIKAKIGLDFIDIQNQDEGDSNIELKAGIGFALGLMIYMFIFIYGVQVMKGVIEEKTNRIVEVIVSSVKPFELMMGKIIGIMLVGLTQFAMWVVLIGVFSTVVVPFILPDGYDAATIAGEVQNVQTTPDVKVFEGPEVQATMQDNEIINFLYTKVPWGSLIGIFLFFFIGGYLLYGSLMAAIGAAVDSETDTQQFMLPVTLPLVFAYIISIMGMQDPNSTVMQWCSQIPFTSPVVMLVRYTANLGGGESMTLSLIISMVLLIAAFIGTTWLAGKIYRTGILMYGKKVTYKELFKWLKY